MNKNEIEETKRLIKKYSDDIYVSTVRLMDLELNRDPNSLPNLWKVLNETDRFQHLSKQCSKVLEKYFKLETENKLPINFTYRALYKELNKTIKP